MGAETNNEQFKLENLFNVKGKGMPLFSFLCLFNHGN